MNAPVRPPDVVGTRAALIRAAIADDFELVIRYAENGLDAIEVGVDFDLGRAFDEMAKIFLSAAKSFEDLIEAQSIP